MDINKKRILFVGGLPATMSEETLEKHFSGYGQVSKVKIMRDKKTKVPKCYAFVTMSNPDLLPVIVSDSQIIEGRRLDCQIASRKGEKKDWKEDQKKRRIFVTNLSDEHTSEQLHECFSQFGELRTAYVIYDYFTKLSKNYGYVEFKDQEAANKALNSEVFLKGSHVLCVPFMGKHDKRKRKQSEEDEVEEEYFMKHLPSREDKRDSGQSPSTIDPLNRLPESSDDKQILCPHIHRNQIRRKISFRLTKALESGKRISESLSNYRLNVCCNTGDRSRASRLDYAAWFRITQHGSQQQGFVLKTVSPTVLFPSQANPFPKSQEVQRAAFDLNQATLDDQMNCSSRAQI